MLASGGILFPFWKSPGRTSYRFGKGTKGVKLNFPDAVRNDQTILLLLPTMFYLFYCTHNFVND